jgi:hypothetical protein
VLDKIVLERDSFKASPTSQKSWLLDRLNKALSWYNGWRQGLLRKPRCAGAVAWAAVSVADLITLVTRAPDMEDPIRIGVPVCNLPIVGRPNTRRARNAINNAADDLRGREGQADVQPSKRQRKAAVEASAERTPSRRMICGKPNQASKRLSQRLRARR